MNIMQKKINMYYYKIIKKGIEYKQYKNVIKFNQKKK